MRLAAQDKTTIDFYAREWQAYTGRGEPPAMAELDAFLAGLPLGARILELGCGAGQDSEIMIARGFDVLPTDGTPEIARAAEIRLGRPVQVLLFDDIDQIEAFDGIWANACLLHVPMAGLQAILDRIYRALRPQGLFYASFKAGNGEGRDRFDRFFNYPDREALEKLYTSLDWANVDISERIGAGYDRLPTRWWHVYARR